MAESCAVCEDDWELHPLEVPASWLSHVETNVANDAPVVWLCPICLLDATQLYHSIDQEDATTRRFDSPSSFLTEISMDAVFPGSRIGDPIELGK